MNLLHTLIATLQVLSALGVIVLVLLQHGKGADMGAAFGSGASGSLFGATGSANFLSRLTAGMATVFFLSTLGLVFVTNRAPVVPTSVMEQPAPAGADASIPSVTPPVPAAPVAPAGSQADPAQKDGVSSEIPK